MIGGAAALTIAADAPTLWLTDLDDRTTRDRAEAVALLPGEAALYAGRADAGERLLRRRLARLLLASAAGIRADAVAIGRSVHGAPEVAAPAGWHLSLAARWPACLIGIARLPLGVDIERLEAAPPALDLLTRHERDRLAARPASEHAGEFTRAWVAKESHAKRFGDPMRADPATIDTAENCVVSPSGTTRCWRYDDGRLVAAVATGG